MEDFEGAVSLLSFRIWTGGEKTKAASIETAFLLMVRARGFELWHLVPTSALFLQGKISEAKTGIQLNATFTTQKTAATRVTEWLNYLGGELRGRKALEFRHINFM